ncbi:NADPH-dependent oxidoreductase [Carbonactinospora thermoautotrophica]|uniref:NADPH-dependent FMN reductase n=1 Tax=Carbonactinospora thermoautotrophica TaxID=1469144 RepID=A0A132MU11_9ACTN|nr:NAD(P)H-dependent oxidoreductase [Carbonactinospora thermoautotrophica]KWX01226.1 NADPH-dependent FMN reductase [Carbonactinospora thermoautotrophica]KWX05567.1 NADPH-dependent FMN reductase [Carbonactinospora thermoautotrophica]KWX06789.1 NADPH-dependent FMN reductase [Carbonactinospora thermoautotrophica]MCX9193084.1 NADPH-dependent oxidoreductase [Carbonactinospora thermoautotrophica]
MLENAHFENAEQLRLAVIVGSVREGRFGPTVANWFVGQADERADMSVDVVDLVEVQLPLALPAFGTKPVPETARALEGLTPRLAAADAFVVVTPEYNHSFPASLKNVIDWHNQVWHAKPVGFVSYGGLSGGLRAVEQLRVVFAELHAVTIRATVSFHNAWSQFDNEGQPIDPAGCNGAAKSMLDQLAWWARALREARAARPYTA